MSNEKKPKHVQRDLYMLKEMYVKSNETYVCEKRPIYVADTKVVRGRGKETWGTTQVSKGNHVLQKRPYASEKRHILWKETDTREIFKSKETYVCEKRPIYVANTKVVRG